MQKFPWELFLQSTGALSGGAKDVILICKAKQHKLSLSFNILPGKPRFSMGKPKYFRVARKLRGCIVPGVGVGCKTRWELQGALAAWPSSPWSPTYLRETGKWLVGPANGRSRKRKEILQMFQVPKRQVSAHLGRCYSAERPQGGNEQGRFCFSIKYLWCSILCPEAYENQVNGDFRGIQRRKLGSRCEY